MNANDRPENLCIHDYVTYFGQLMGRLVYIKGNWAGVFTGCQERPRIDEFRLDLLRRAK